jgi:hypothetical protein
MARKTPAYREVSLSVAVPANPTDPHALATVLSVPTNGSDHNPDLVLIGAPYIPMSTVKDVSI